ncbi:plastocyanin/azurin family copper-binding protein [Asinibacterium sp. OR53]|uniref:plastocyanin/azurin family copper-binding protein n=1 Tax=Asinibacterium sp. OR53 TaxID=925409 RepID=UPI00047AE4FE|nr:plastocyanin/azurin family copper-binding protein [Asinibacterium sp. OR53]
MKTIILLTAILLAVSCSSPSVKGHKTYTVEIAQMKFSPATITVDKGDSILFVNHDLVAHDVTEQSKKAWSSSVLQPGASWKMEAVSSADYYCSIHVVMKGKITVN